MATSLRAQFSATKTKTLKSIVDTENEMSNSGKPSDYLKYTEGDNKFRIMPKHPGEEAFSKMRGVHWVSAENEDGKEGRRSVNNARITIGAEKDIIEEYIKFCTQNLDSSESEDAEKIKKLTNWEGGLGLSNSWLCYAMKVTKGSKEFGLLELKKTIRDGMNSLAITEDEEEAIETDPWTDPDDGIPIIVTYKAAAKAKDKYKVKNSKNQLPLTDEELEMFSKKTPISQLPQFRYGSDQFELALEGLRLFDENNEINLFDTDEFQEIVEECKGMIGDSKSDDDEDEKPKKKGSKEVKKSVKKSSKDDEDDEDEEEDEEEQPKKKPGKVVDKKVVSKKPAKDEDEDEDSDEDEDTDDEVEEEVEEKKPSKKPAVVEKKPVGKVAAKKPAKDEDEDDEELPFEEDEDEAEDDEEEKPAKKVASKAADKPVAKKTTMEDIKAKLAAIKKK